MVTPVPPAPTLVTVAQAARNLGVSTACVRGWIDEGLLAASRRSDGTLRISERELQRARQALGFQE
jgi:DNA-binding transcriptional MerR regulator